MLDVDIAKVLGAPSPLPPLTPETIAQLRDNMATMGRQLAGGEVASVEDHDVGGVPVRLYRPSIDGPLPLLVFLHGGGWVFGNLESHDAMHRQIASRAGCAVLAVGYRLAPEHPFPAGLADCATAFAWARREAVKLGCDGTRIALGGESAGGNLAAALTLQLRDADELQPLFQLLVHPVTDLTLSQPSITTVEAPGLSRDYLAQVVSLYAAQTPLTDPLLSPLHAPRPSGLAAAIVLTAAEDPLRDDGEVYALRLASAGVETLVRRLPGLPHGFLFLPATIPAVDAAFGLIASLVRRYFDQMGRE